MKCNLRSTCVVAALSALAVLAQIAEGGIELTDARSTLHPQTGLMLIYGELKLPAAGWWFVAPENSDQGQVRDLMLNAGREAIRRNRPRSEEEDEESLPGSPTAAGDVAYTIIGRVASTNIPAAITVAITNLQVGRGMSVQWSLRANLRAADDQQIIQTWARGQVGRWTRLYEASESPILEKWLIARNAQYGVSAAGSSRDLRRRGDRNRRGTDMFSILGGRAAIQETLQMEVLRPRGGGSAGQAVPIAQIRGVEIKAHPFGELLGGKEGGRLALAEVVPPDRFFLYFAHPATVSDFLGRGEDFIYRLGTMLAGNSCGYDIKSACLRRLGLDEQSLRQMLSAGAASEIAVFMPDLFFIDGADLTVVARLKNAARLQSIFKALGLGKLADGAVVPVAKEAGQSSCWCIKNDLFIMSTSRAELDGVLAFVANGGRASLGQSEEFRYMLTKLPVTPSTRLFAYCSDPFIRRLVSPAVKIGQLRRQRARGAIEQLTAAALLHRLDRGAPPENIAVLAERFPGVGDVAAEGCAIRPDGVVVSAAWGTADNMAALSRNPVTEATPPEAEAYRNYMENYSRFWRQFFDPIAIRIEDAPGDRYVMTTFILPLVENSIYDQVRQVIAPAGDKLRVPLLDPKPVLLFSMKLNEKLLREGMRELRMDMGPNGLTPGLIEQFAGTLHLAVQDGDPIIALGAGDILGALGGDAWEQIGRGGEMIAIPILLSVLTRPCAILAEVRDPAAVRAILRRGPALRLREREFRLSVSQVGDSDAWIYTADILGVIKIKFGVEVIGDYLVVDNLPWSQKIKVAGTAEAPCAGAAIQVNPGAVVRQLPALYHAMADQQRAAAMQGVGILQPIVEALGCATPAEALAAHRRLFGFAPEHPEGGQWEISGGIVRSSLFGRPGKERIPAYDPARGDFGLFKDIPAIDLSMHFEEAGLRSVCQWSTRRQ